MDMTKGNIKKFKKNKGYESLSRDMLQDTENLSLQAIGLLSYLTSLPEGWQIHKTELYRKFNKNGKKSVSSAWNNLVESGYIIQFKIRNGKKFDYKYYHFHEPFTQADILMIEETEGFKVWDGTKENSSISLAEFSNAPKEHSNSSNAPFELPILNSPKGAYIKLTNKEINYQDKDIDTLDTENPSYPHYTQKVDSKVKTREQYMNDAFYQNAEKVPEEISNMLKAFFGNDIERAESSYQTILRAKKKVEDEIGTVIWLEHDLETIQVVIQAFSLAIRKVERESVVSNPEGYIYTSVYNALANHYKNFNLSPNLNAPYYNWLEEEDTY